MRVNEIFRSIQGEGLRTGLPCTFIRLAGCNLRCEGWPCDTQYAQGIDGSLQIEPDRLVEAIKEWPHYLVWTGGEPLLQAETEKAILACEFAGYLQDLFTNGSIPITPLLMTCKRLNIVMDYKLPSSGEYDKMCKDNLVYLRDQDSIKGVISNQEDLDIFLRDTKKVVCQRIVTPAWDKVQPAELVDWIFRRHANVRLGLQVHKYIWEPNLRGV